MNILEKAQEVTHGDRNQNYGDPIINHDRIAGLWNAYREARDYAPEWGEVRYKKDAGRDVAVMMILTKIARLIETPDHFDSWADIAGYAWVGSKCAGVEDESD